MHLGSCPNLCLAWVIAAICRFSFCSHPLLSLLNIGDNYDYAATPLKNTNTSSGSNTNSQPRPQHLTGKYMVTSTATTAGKARSTTTIVGKASDHHDSRQGKANWHSSGQGEVDCHDSGQGDNSSKKTTARQRQRQTARQCQQQQRVHRHNNSDGKQQALSLVASVQYSRLSIQNIIEHLSPLVQKITADVGWNRFQPTITGHTTDDNQSVVVRLSVGQCR
ncbi:hypothetical protein EDB83DRAFT_2310867 [Lactarius deliciosus]|nr:hypothetical protein EDB83DRAFT_2310867 [Lactarius deliciosus]